MDLTITFAGARTQRPALGTPRYPLRTFLADYQQPGAKPIPAYDYSFAEHRWLPAPERGYRPRRSTAARRRPGPPDLRTVPTPAAPVEVAVAA